MDAFYASVEVRRRPELRGKPVIVAASARGAWSARPAYEARTFGIRSAMPATRRAGFCPHAAFLPPDFAEYRGRPGRDADLPRVTPLVEPLSMDEAFLDVAGAQRCSAGPPGIAATSVAGSYGAGVDLFGRVAPSKFRGQAGLHPGQAGRAGRGPRRPHPGIPAPAAGVALWEWGERSAEVLRRLGLVTVRTWRRRRSA